MSGVTAGLWLVLWFLLQCPGNVVGQNVGALPEQATAPETVTVNVTNGAGLAAALAWDRVAVVELLADIHCTDTDWRGLATPVTLNRNITVRSAPSLGYAVLLDMGGVANKVHLMPSHMLLFEHVVVSNVRPTTPVRTAPGLDVLTTSPPPAPGEMRPIVRLQNGGTLYRICWSAAVQAAASLPLRPPEIGPQERQAWEVALRPPLGTCVNSSRAPLMQRCWPLTTHAIDLGAEGVNVDAVGQLVSAGYVVHLVNVYAMCEALVSDECIARQGVLACWTIANGVQGPEAMAGGNGTSGAAGSGMGGTGGRGAGEAALRVVLPAALLTGVVGLVAAAGGLVWWWGRKGQAGIACPAKDGIPGNGPSTTSVEPDKGGPPADHALLDPTAAGSACGTYAAGSALFPDGPSPLPLTSRTPVLAHVNLDLRWGVDVLVDHGALRGAGSFGRVHEGCYHGSRVAVKVVHRGSCTRAAQEQAIAALRHEAFLLGRCHHPNIVSLLGACLTPPHLCLVMELMDQSLAHKLVADPLMPLPQVLQIATDIACGLAYLHPTVVHRDLKPDNVLLDAQGTAKLTDFGLARLRVSVCGTQHSEAGTAAYMAPECFDPDRHFLTHKADIFSWGVVVWEMLSGCRPWLGQNPMAVAMAMTCTGGRLPLDTLPGARCPARLRELISECWDSVPQRRPCAEEVVKRLALVGRDLACPMVQAAPAGACVDDGFDASRLLRFWKISGGSSKSRARGSPQGTEASLGSLGLGITTTGDVSANLAVCPGPAQERQPPVLDGDGHGNGDGNGDGDGGSRGLAGTCLPLTPAGSAGAVPTGSSSSHDAARQQGMPA